jgi:hypothetical protein
MSSGVLLAVCDGMMTALGMEVEDSEEEYEGEP